MGEARRRPLAGQTPGQKNGGGHSEVPESRFAILIVDSTPEGHRGLAVWKESFNDFGQEESVWRSSGYQFFVDLREKSTGQSVLLSASPDFGAFSRKTIPLLVSKVREAGGGGIDMFVAAAPEMAAAVQAEWDRYWRPAT